MDATPAHDHALTEMVHASVPVLAAMGLRVVSAAPTGAVAVLPHAENRNHVGTSYAGSLFSVGEMLGGLVGLSMGLEGFAPIVRRMEVEYLAPARSDVTATVSLTEEEVAAVLRQAREDGRAPFTLEARLLDAEGTLVARTRGDYQLRRF